MIPTSDHDPYEGNRLTQGLGPILSRSDILTKLLQLPPRPVNLEAIPVHIRLHYLMRLRDLHIPSLEGAKLHTTIDLMLRQSYRYRNPDSVDTWRMVGAEPGAYSTPRAPASAALAVGLSGTGKTEAALRSFNLYPRQVIHHHTFPHMANGLKQVVWLSTDVPATGRSADLAANLMMSWDRATNGTRFAAALSKNRRNGIQMLDEWRQVALSHFLGALHLDEIQNLFKIQTLEQRAKSKKTEEGRELRIIEDAALKWILNLTNIWQMPVLLSGTPDGVGALTKRLATTQRIVTAGYHHFSHFRNADDPSFCDVFFPHLCEYQYVLKKLPSTDGFRQLIIELTGGLPRIIIALWIAAHRVAFERKDDDLRMEDFRKASITYLAPLAPAIAALLSNDPKRMSRYEDLMPREDGYWTLFWSGVTEI